MDLRVLTYNIHKGFRTGGKKFVLHEIRELVRSTGVDLVFLQEVIGENERFAGSVSNWPVKAQYEFLADEVWSDFRYGQNAAYDGGHHGNAILSRFPITHWENHNISTNKIEKRGLLFTEISLPDNKKIYAGCTHLDLTARGQRMQIANINSWLRDKLEPASALILAGDFNDWRDRASHSLAGSINVIEAVREFHGRLLPTFPAYYPLLRLDRIYQRGFKVIDAHVQTEKVWKTLSDHIPVCATLRIATNQS